MHLWGVTHEYVGTNVGYYVSRVQIYLIVNLKSYFGSL